jgi:hypothetical protein
MVLVCLTYADVTTGEQALAFFRVTSFRMGISVCYSRSQGVAKPKAGAFAPALWSCTRI